MEVSLNKRQTPVQYFTKTVLFSILGTMLFIVGMSHLFTHKEDLGTLDVVIIIILPIIGAMVIGGLFASPESIQKFFNGLSKVLMSWKKQKEDNRDGKDS